jgi:serine/threonine protein kinase
MERNDPLIGKQLGTCVLDRVIGAGGMGMVYLAHQTRPVRDVAVKVLRSGAGLYTDAHREFLVRFRREANVIARLDHINILHIYGYDEQDGLAYLVVPYLTGGSLRDLLKKRGKLSPQEAFKYIEQAGAALQYAHEHQIVHRDIKPGNMLFHADGRLVLADFGIARIVHDSSISDLSDPSITAVGQFLGSAEYMAPEMVQGHKVDHRADLYELGIVLFQMLVGRVPFQGSTVLSIAAMHINETPRSLTQIDSSIPAALDAVVQKVLSKNPEDRYASAHEFVEAVRTAIIPPVAFLPNSHSYPGSQYYPSSQPDYRSNPGSQIIQDKSNPPFTSPANSSSLSNESAQYATESTHVVDHASYPHSMDSLHGNGSTVYAHVMQSFQTSEVSYDRSSKSRSGLTWIAAFGIVIVLGVMAVLLGPIAIQSFNSHGAPTPTALALATAKPTVQVTATPTAQATATPIPSAQATAVIQLLYGDINKTDFRDAYTQFSTSFQQRLSYNDFVAGYANTKHDEVTYEGTILLGDGSYQCNVSIDATEIDENGALTHSIYIGYYIVGLDNDEWKIFPTSNLQKT